MTTDSNFTNREKRFEVNELIGFDAIVKRAGSDENVFYADLIDFSRRGGKFELPFCARFDEVLDVQFEFKESSLSYVGTGRVRHMRNVGENRWQVGCSLDPPLPEDVVSYLAKRTNQERRRHTRFDICGEGRLRRQGTVDSCEAVIRNISRGGFCLFVPDRQEVGEKVDLVIGEQALSDSEESQNNEIKAEPLNVGARVRWQNSVEDGFVIGCSFTDVQSYSQLVDHLLGTEKVEHDKTNWLVLAAAFLVMVIPVYVSLATSDGGTSVNPVTIASTDAESRNTGDPITDSLVLASEPTATDLVESISANAEPSQDPALSEQDDVVFSEPNSPVPSESPVPKTTKPLITQPELPNPQPSLFEFDLKPAKPTILEAGVSKSGPRAKSSRRNKSIRVTSNGVKAKTGKSPEEEQAGIAPSSNVSSDGIPRALKMFKSQPRKDSKSDRGSSRRNRTSRPIIIESEEIKPVSRTFKG